jgi:hypothetical protein
MAIFYCVLTWRKEGRRTKARTPFGRFLERALIPSWTPPHDLVTSQEPQLLTPSLGVGFHHMSLRTHIYSGTSGGAERARLGVRHLGEPHTAHVRVLKGKCSDCHLLSMRSRRSPASQHLSAHVLCSGPLPCWMYSLGPVI